MATQYVIYNKKDRSLVPGSPFPSLADANAHITRHSKKQPSGNSAAPSYEVVAVSV